MSEVAHRPSQRLMLPDGGATEQAPLSGDRFRVRAALFFTRSYTTILRTAHADLRHRMQAHRHGA
jgi:hypothetical protein